MAVSEQETTEGHSDSSTENVKQTDRKERMLTKIVIRRLPPSMTKETLINQISPLPDYDFIYFVKADLSLGEFAFGRAYISFKNSTDIYIFKEKFDNYVFLDAKGNEYPAVVEFALFSHIPKRRNKKVNPKCGTIETDPLYNEFVESLNKVPSETEEKPEYCLQPSVEEDKNVQSTPLLEYVKQKRLDRQKLKEEKREERKRREIERKRLKEEERKGRKRLEHVGHTHNLTKITTNTTKTISAAANADGNEINKTDIVSKTKDKRIDEYRGKSGKLMKEYPDKRTTYTTNKEIHRSLDQKKTSPSKIRQRNMIEKEPRRNEYKNKRDDFGHRKREEKEEKMEKKVKKYSERREERKNEIKRQETKSEGDSNVNKESDQKSEENVDEKSNDEPKPDPESTPDNELRINENLANEEATAENKEFEETPKEETKYRNENDKVDAQKEYGKNEKDDPRTQRRIRNKDRPTMAIYQPGMGLIRNKKLSESADEAQKPTNNSDANKQDSGE